MSLLTPRRGNVYNKVTAGLRACRFLYAHTRPSSAIIVWTILFIMVPFAFELWSVVLIGILLTPWIGLCEIVCYFSKYGDDLRSVERN